MRTTIELPDALRAQLLSLAAQRGEKGFSRLVETAVERFLAQEEGRGAVVRDALAALGSLPAEDAKRVRGAIRGLRETWRTS